MIVSTHSPILLAGSRIGEEKITWSTLENYVKKSNKNVTLYKDEEIKEMGKMMGDPNFHLYFLAAQKTPLIFIEDGKELTSRKYTTAGIPVFRGLNGVQEIAKYLEVYTANPNVINTKIFFIADADKGKDNLSRFYDEKDITEESHGFKKFLVKNTKDLFIILLPQNFAVEDLFIEFDNHLEECVSKLWDTSNFKQRSNFPRELFRTFGKVRSSSISSKEEAKNLIRNTDDVKDLFWEKVEKYDYKFKKDYCEALKILTK